jgi:dienelactone hydrolase
MILPAALAAPAFAQPVSGAVKVGFADTRSEIDRDRIVVLGWSDGGALLAALKHHIGPMPLQARAAIAFSPSCSMRTPAAPCLEFANWTPKVVVRALPESGDGFEAILEFLERELR